MSTNEMKKEVEGVILKNLVKLYLEGKFNKIRFVKLVIEAIKE